MRREHDAALGDVRTRIAARLRDEIRSGRYHAGDPLPSTNELAAEEGAAPMTVRAAYAELIAEGLVVSVPRRGHFVRTQLALTWQMNAWQDPARLATLPLDGWTADVEAAGLSGRQTIAVGMVTADTRIAGHSLAELFDLAADEPVAVRRRIRYIGPGEEEATEPESLADSYYPYSLVRGSEITAPTSVNTAAVLAARGAGLHHYTDELIPRMATQDEAARMQLPAVTAVLEQIRSGYTADNRAVLVQHMIRLGQGSRYIYHVTYPEGE